MAQNKSQRKHPYLLQTLGFKGWGEIKAFHMRDAWEVVSFEDTTELEQKMKNIWKDEIQDRPIKRWKGIGEGRAMNTGGLLLPSRGERQEVGVSRHVCETPSGALLMDKLHT